MSKVYWQEVERRPGYEDRKEVKGHYNLRPRPTKGHHCHFDLQDSYDKAIQARNKSTNMWQGTRHWKLKRLAEKALGRYLLTPCSFGWQKNIDRKWRRQRYKDKLQDQLKEYEAEIRHWTKIYWKEKRKVLNALKENTQMCKVCRRRYKRTLIFWWYSTDWKQEC